MNVVVVGAGPAGIMAAIQASDSGHEVTLIDKNAKIGRKLYISGKGRCNVTNACDYNDFLKNVVSNPKFLMSALRTFGTEDTQNFFEWQGVPLKIERGNRVFPVSDKSSDIIDALFQALKARNIKLKLETELLDIITRDDGKISEILTNHGKVECQHLVIATGGSSYPKTGSDGKVFNLLRKLGHTVVKPVAALSEIIVYGVNNYKGETISLEKLPLPEGLSLKNVTLSAVIKQNAKIISQEFGEMLFTDEGLSGPIALTLSSKINRQEFNNITLKLDLKPSLDVDTLDKRILQDFSVFSNKIFINSLSQLLPKSLIPFIVATCGIDKNKAVHSITKEERNHLLKALKELTFTVKGLAPIEHAIVTAGGVNTKEINPKTLKSNIISNLSFAGEVIDVDALTGGFNIQIALSTGYAAGTSI